MEVLTISSLPHEPCTPATLWSFEDKSPTTNSYECHVNEAILKKSLHETVKKQNVLQCKLEKFACQLTQCLPSPIYGTFPMSTVTMSRLTKRAYLGLGQKNEEIRI